MCNRYIVTCSSLDFLNTSLQSPKVGGIIVNVVSLVLS